MTRDELLAARVPRGQIDRRIEKGALIPEYPGVYRAGHAARSRESGYMAAVKAGGPGAVLQNAAAGHLLGLLQGRTWPPPEVLTLTERKPKGLRTRRTRNPDPRDVTEVQGIPRTTAPRTLVDLAATLGDEELAKAVLKRPPNAKGAAKLRAIASGDTKVIPSYLGKVLLPRPACCPPLASGLASHHAGRSSGAGAGPVPSGSPRTGSRETAETRQR